MRSVCTGVYLAENSSKSDEYCPPGPTQFMFLCRVALGNPHTTLQPRRNLRRPPCVQGHFDFAPNPPCGHDRCDSVLAPSKKQDAGACLERFREFITYSRDNCYPE